MHPLIETNRKQINELCKKHQVKKLFVFGSVVRDDFTPESDVDFLVEFNDTIHEFEKSIENEDSLKTDLSHLLKKEIDLIKYSALKNKYLRYFINKEKKLIYAEA